MHATSRREPSLPPGGCRSAITATVLVAAALTTPSVADGPFFFLPTVVTLPTPASVTMVAAGDLDLDGDPDLVVTGRNADGLAYVILNDQGTFGVPSPLEVGGQTDVVEIGDIDGDGFPDLVFAGRSVRGRLAVCRGRGDGTFREPEEIPLGREPRSVLARDLDGDGDLDLVGLNHREPVIEILRNDGSGSFERLPSILVGGATPGIPYPQALAAGDLDQDGDLDLAIVCTGESRVHFARNRGDATFDPPEGWRPVRVAGEIGGMTDVELGDLDGDGDLESVVPLILLQSVSHVGVFTNSDDPSAIRFARETAAPATAGGYAFTTALADLDGDGDLDVITGQAIPGPLNVLDNRTETTASGGDGVIRFEPPQVLVTDSFFRSVTAVDIDGDCDQDVIAVDLVSNSVWILRNETEQARDCQGVTRTAVRRPVKDDPIPIVRRKSSDDVATIDPDRLVDLDGDGVVDGSDLAILLGRLGGPLDSEVER